MRYSKIKGLLAFTSLLGSAAAVEAKPSDTIVQQLVSKGVPKKHIQDFPDLEWEGIVAYDKVFSFLHLVYT